MKLKKVLLNATLALLLLASISSIGCARTTVLHPIEKSDIFSMESGKSYTPEKTGWFLSDYYMEEVAKVKVE